MLNKTNETKPVPSQFVLTPEQRIALFQGKVERAEAHIRALAELTAKLKRK